MIPFGIVFTFYDSDIWSSTYFLFAVNTLVVPYDWARYNRRSLIGTVWQPNVGAALSTEYLRYLTLPDVVASHETAAPHAQSAVIAAVAA